MVLNDIMNFDSERFEPFVSAIGAVIGLTVILVLLGYYVNNFIEEPLRWLTRIMLALGSFMLTGRSFNVFKESMFQKTKTASRK